MLCVFIHVKVCSLWASLTCCTAVPRCQVALVLASKTERAVLLSCNSGQYTDNGECCLECPPGEGVVKKCGATQTVCAQCLDSEYRLNTKLSTLISKSYDKACWLLYTSIWVVRMLIGSYWLISSWPNIQGSSFRKPNTIILQCNPLLHLHTAWVGTLNHKKMVNSSNDIIITIKRLPLSSFFILGKS